MFIPFPNTDIPEGLSAYRNIEEDVSVLIGSNGCGKSTLLNTIARHFAANSITVIAIANSIHDKFNVKYKSFSILRGRSGRRQAEETLKKAIINNATKRGDSSFFINRVLNYVDFDEVIGIKVNGLTPNFEDKLKSSPFEDLDGEKALALLYDYIYGQNSEGIAWLNDRYRNSYGLNEQLTQLITLEKQLKSNKLIRGIEVFLSKKGKPISLLSASSGELSLITSLIYISTGIVRETVILIDEPENSLHPEWQKDYVKNIFDLFHYQQPKVIIATHSPLILNSAELFSRNLSVFKSENYKFVEQHKEPVNVEEIYFRLFDIFTPQNQFLSERVVRLMNVFAEGKLTIEGFDIAINQMSSRCYDVQQISTLENMKNLARLVKEDLNDGAI